MKQIWILAILFFSHFGWLEAQTITQTVRGQVRDATTLEPLSGANVVLFETTFQMATDSAGSFRMEAVPVGRYAMVVSYLGYDNFVLSELLVESGKEVVLEVQLRQNVQALEQVVITGNRNSLVPIQPLSVRTITVEETLRYPATFFDPARLASSYAGVAGDNDQANGLSVRGNSPNSMSWWLEGVPIVNPNHTPNAGTINDRVTQNSGGVNILSAQLLGNTNFYSGVFPVSFGNTLGGVLDMRLREGNNEQLEFTGQAGLIGLDIAVEGPLSKQSGSSCLVNYRYSTVGLLTAVGVPLGDEEINFQDLSFHLSFPQKNGSRFRIFGLAGTSENLFEAERDSSLWEFQKDRFDINFDSRMGALGAVYTMPLGKSVWQTALIGSALESSRTAARLNEEYAPVLLDTDELVQSKLALHSSLRTRFNSALSLKAGIIGSRESHRVLSITDGDFREADGSGEGWLLQPYVNIAYFLTDNFRVEAGLNSIYFSLYEKANIGPRISLQYYLNDHQYLSLAAGRYSQTQPYQLTAGLGNNGQNLELDFTNSTQVVLGYLTGLGPWGVLELEGFYQKLTDVPVTETATSFSALNYISGAPGAILKNKGEGENYGIEISWERKLRDNYFFLANATLYESRYLAGDGFWRDTRFAGNYIFNLTGGREKQWERSDGRVYSLGTHARVVYLGGFKDTPIDTEASASSGKTVYSNFEAFSLRQADYFRIDFRIYFKRNKENFSSTLALDIQNLTNQENVAYSYYDQEQQAIVTQNQLGLIPVLSYRIEF